MPDIFEEVDEALRRERVEQVWSRHKILILLALVGVVLGAGAYSGLKSWNRAHAERATDALLAARKAPDKVAALEAFAQDHPSDVRALALFAAADSLAASKDVQKAEDLYRKIAGDERLSKIHRDRARILAARALAVRLEISKDKPTEAARTSLEEMDRILAEKNNVWASQARLAAAILAAYALNDPERARAYLGGLMKQNSQDIPLSLQRLAEQIDHGLALRVGAAQPVGETLSKQEKSP